jgi:hypothetical protein
MGSSRYTLVELTDNSTSRVLRSSNLSAVLSAVFPHPVRYRQVWHFPRGDKSIYAWKAQPPEGFVALGMMCTTSGSHLKLRPYRTVCPIPLFSFTCFIVRADAQPDVREMRCIPEAWCVPTTVTPTKIWDDTGSGGGKPGSVWAINSMDLICVSAGHERPKETFFELKNSRFMVDQFAQTENGVVSFI